MHQSQSIQKIRCHRTYNTQRQGQRSIGYRRKGKPDHPGNIRQASRSHSRHHKGIAGDGQRMVASVQSIPTENRVQRIAKTCAQSQQNATPADILAALQHTSHQHTSHKGHNKSDPFSHGKLLVKKKIGEHHYNGRCRIQKHCCHGHGCQRDCFKITKVKKCNTGYTCSQKTPEIFQPDF